MSYLNILIYMIQPYQVPLIERKVQEIRRENYDLRKLIA